MIFQTLHVVYDLIIKHFIWFVGTNFVYLQKAINNNSKSPIEEIHDKSLSSLVNNK